MTLGARKKFLAPVCEPKAFCEQMYRIEEKTCDTVGTFRRSQVIRRQGVVLPLPTLVTPWCDTSRKNAQL